MRLKEGLPQFFFTEKASWNSEFYHLKPDCAGCVLRAIPWGVFKRELLTLISISGASLNKYLKYNRESLL